MLSSAHTFVCADVWLLSAQETASVAKGGNTADAPAPAEDAKVKGARKAKNAEGRAARTEQQIYKAQQAAFESITESMPFGGSWEGESYQMLYTADMAGDFDFHVWCVHLPTSPSTAHYRPWRHVARPSHQSLFMVTRGCNRYVAEGSSIREKLPGSPFALKVSEGRANPNGCLIRGAEELRGQAIPGIYTSVSPAIASCA